MISHIPHLPDPMITVNCYHHMARLSLYTYIHTYIWTTLKPLVQCSFRLTQLQLNICKPVGPVSKIMEPQALQMYIATYGHHSSPLSCMPVGWLAVSDLNSGRLHSDPGRLARNGYHRVAFKYAQVAYSHPTRC